MMAIVVDCSVVMALCFPDEESAVAERGLEAMSAEGAIVPAIWWFEVRNTLLVGERRGRIDASRTAAFLRDLGLLPVRLDREPDEVVLMALAREHKLTAYDAAYLEVALRRRMPLLTLDRRLRAAATLAGARLFRARG